MFAAPLLSLSLALGLAPARAQDDPPAEVVAWVAKVESAYGHYKSVEPGWEADTLTGPLCPNPAYPLGAAAKAQLGPEQKALGEGDVPALSAACQALRPRGWRVKLELIPVDQRVFSPVVLRVSRAAKGETGDAVLAALLAHGAGGSKAYQAVLGSGPYLVEVNAPCGASGLWAYELEDAVRAVESINPGAPVRRVAVSPCGRTAYAWQDRAAVAADARMPREYWGLDFPEIRDRTLGRPTDDPFAVDPAE